MSRQEPSIMPNLESASDSNDSESPRIVKFVLTGGPCGGKTTALARLSEFFRTNGFRVFTIPEAATTLWSSGVRLSDILTSNDTRYWFQDTILNFQLQLEDGFERIARSLNKPCVLLCDRGTLDGAAYIEQDAWEALLRDKSLGRLSIRDGRYDAIFHLVTAAIGAEAFYSLLNNETRSETPDNARQVDLRTQAVWNGHPRHFVIDNSTDFEGKLDRMQTKAAKLVGLPQIPKGADRWMFKTPPDPSTFAIPYEKTHVRKVYLTNVGAALKDGRRVVTQYNYVEERSQAGGYAYAHTKKRRLEDGNEAELKRIITYREFLSHIESSADSLRKPVLQTRWSFLWQNQAFVVIHHQTDDSFEQDTGFWTLRRQAEGGEPNFPPFLKVGDHIEDEDALLNFPASKQPQSGDRQDAGISAGKRDGVTCGNVGKVC